MKNYLKSVVLIANKILTTKDASIRLQNHNKINEEVTDHVYDIDYMDMHMRLHVSDTSPVFNKISCRTLYYLERISFWTYGFKVERTPLWGELSVAGHPVARFRQAGYYSADYATFVSYEQHKKNYDLVSDLTLLLVSGD